MCIDIKMSIVVQDEKSNANDAPSLASSSSSLQLVKQYPVLACLMVRDVASRVRVSIDSIRGAVDALLVYDTGSVDNTKEVIREACKENEITLYEHEGPWVNFEVCRNKMLQIAGGYKEYVYLLLLDSEDELVNGDVFRTFIVNQSLRPNPEPCFFIKLRWKNGITSITENNFQRLVRNNYGFAYKGVVHEYIYSTQCVVQRAPFINTFWLFQDRTLNPSKDRFVRDRDLLLAEHERDPDESRTIFYLAQTYRSIGDVENALKYYALYCTKDIPVDKEYPFQAHLNKAQLMMQLNHSWPDVQQAFLSAYKIIPRVEALLPIAWHYRAQDDFHTSYIYVSMACKLDYPTSYLFVDRNAYLFDRWALMSIVAYYVGQISEGLHACKQALADRPNDPMIINNLPFYKKTYADPNHGFIYDIK